ncbi:MAG TPA: HlyC/CorC family transporter [Sorangium sp.]|nr:HlyC/CorC family transporter [Sorangium sp.]
MDADDSPKPVSLTDNAPFDAPPNAFATHLNGSAIDHGNMPLQATMAVGHATPPAAPPAAGADAGDNGGALIVFVLAVSCALVFSFLCSIAESVLLSVSRSTVAAMEKSGSRAGKLLSRWKSHDIEVPIASILILNTLAHTVGATFAGSSYAKVFPPSTTWVFSLLFTLAVLIGTEIVPKTVGVLIADRLAGTVTVVVAALSSFFRITGILTVTNFISKLLKRSLKTGDQPITSIEEIRVLAAMGSREGAVGARVASFIEGIASLRELTAHDVMVPRSDMAFLSGTKTLDENLEIIRESGHSRFPFTATGELEQADGVVLAKELLFLDHDTEDGAEPDWDALKHTMVVVPETKTLDQLLITFQGERNHLAVVVDEYGGVQGVVTLEDVLEEIVGEIDDETDRVERLIVKRAGGVLLCRGRAETRKLFRLLDVDEKPEFVTVSGMVTALLGRVPVKGDEISWRNLHFTVLRASRRRAERIEVRLVEDASD